MIIKSLTRYQGDLELLWLNGLHNHPQKGRRIKAQFFNHANGLMVFEDLPFGMLPILMPGLVVSRGEVQIARKSGKQFQLTVPDLSVADDWDVMETVHRSLYSLGGHKGGSQRVLRYGAGGKTILIPAAELIRFLFLHSRMLADALLQPSGLMDLALTSPPDIYSDIQIDFTERMPRKLLTPEFLREFSWLYVHPDGRRAWDSVRRRSFAKRFLTFDPPPLLKCELEFRGAYWNRSWLVLEILSLSGRTLPARTIRWTHPSDCERTGEGPTGGSDRPDVHGPTGNRPQHEREYVVDGDEDGQQNRNQDTVLLGGKRGCFDNKAEVVKVLRPPRSTNSGAAAEGTSQSRKLRSDAGQLVDPDLPPVTIRQSASIGDPAMIGGLPPVEFATLEPAEWDHLGDLGLLNDVLLRIEAGHPDLTLTRQLVFLKRGKAISFCSQRRRACLMAVYTSLTRPPRVLLDVDHTGLNGLAGLLLRYEVACPLVDVSAHVKLLLGAMVDNQGHWDGLAGTRLPEYVTMQRLPKLLRITERAGDEGYVGAWVKRLISLL